jgi:hypothetical protein
MPWSNEYRPPAAAPVGWAVVEPAQGMKVVTDRFGVQLRGAAGVTGPFEVAAFLRAAVGTADPLPGNLTVRVTAGSDGLAWASASGTGTLAAGESEDLPLTDAPALRRAAEGAPPDRLVLLAGSAAAPLGVTALATTIDLLQATPGADVGYQVGFRLRADQAVTGYQPDRFFLQAVRAGVPARPLQLGPPS